MTKETELEAIPVTVVKFDVYEVLGAVNFRGADGGDRARVEATNHLAPIGTHPAADVELW